MLTTVLKPFFTTCHKGLLARESSSKSPATLLSNAPGANGQKPETTRTDSSRLEKTSFFFATALTSSPERPFSARSSAHGPPPPVPSGPEKMLFLPYGEKRNSRSDKARHV